MYIILPKRLSIENILIMSFFKKYNEIWNKVRNRTKKEFDSQPVYKENYLKTEIKSNEGKINTNICGNKIPK